MRRQLTGFMLMLCGLVALGLSFSVGLAPAPVAAMPALQPSPRPTLVPTAVLNPSPVPTAVATAEPSGGGERDSSPKPPPMGRITGTVIDLRTGAPAPGKKVVVGSMELSSDSSGNYDIWQAPGSYPVSLSLRASEGTPAQGITMAKVWGDDTVVVHLYFISLAPTVVTTAIPMATATPLPAPRIIPTLPAMPGDLPDTSVEHRPAQRPATHNAAVKAKPAHLPVTGNELIDPQSLVLGGLALLALGASLMLLPRRAPARVGAPAPRQRQRRRSAQELLEDLLRRDP